MRFRDVIKTGLDELWDLLIVIVRHPIFWLLVVCFVFWTITQSPVPEKEICPTCQQILRR